MRVRLIIAAVTTLAVGAAAAIGVAAWDRSGDPGALTRQEYPAGERPPAPPIGGETLDGDHVDLADLRGDVVVVNVWGSWCGPCRAEMPEFEEVYQATRDEGVSFVGVNIRDERDQAISFAASRVTYPSIFDPRSEYGLGFAEEPPRPPSVPATLVVDRDGNVAAYLYRPVRRTELERIVTGLAAEEAS
jgi:thiol-disulfide isomerase/thioredoxin